MTKSNCIAVAKLIQKFKPHFFVGYARSFIDFINIIESEGISIPSPKGLFCFGNQFHHKLENIWRQNYILICLISILMQKIQ